MWKNVADNKELTEKFFRIFREVFDDTGHVKPIGRFKCIELIRASEQLVNDVDFGNKETGFMNTENIKKLFKEICKRCKNYESKNK